MPARIVGRSVTVSRAVRREVEDLGRRIRNVFVGFIHDAETFVSVLYSAGVKFPERIATSR